MKTNSPHQRWYTDHSHIEGTKLRLLAAVDHYSKRSWLTATETETAEEVIQFFENVFGEGEVPPLEIGCDNGPAFKSHSFSNYVEMKGCTKKCGVPYCPEGQGVVERFHRTVKEMVFFFNYTKLYANLFYNS